MGMRMLILGLLVLLLTACDTDPVAPPVDDHVITFPTRDVTGFEELFRATDEADAMGRGYLRLPVGATASAPVPAMVILHGSGGEWSRRGRRQAAVLTRNGVAALVVDTFVARGLRRDDRYIDRLRRVNLPDQLADAFAALDHLAADPRIDAERIGLMGYSMGGVSAVLAASATVADGMARTAGRFALHASFYAPCFARSADGRTTGAPIVAIWGRRDESTHRPLCGSQVAALRAAGGRVEVHWLEAAHGWNGRSERRFHSTAPHGSPCLFEVGVDGTVVERVTGRPAPTDEAFIDVLRACTDQGYTIGHDAAAEAEANRLLLEVIAENLR